MNGIPQSYHGKPLIHFWQYHAKDGSLLDLLVARYQIGTEKKVCIPFHKCNGSNWKTGIGLVPPPLFGVNTLNAPMKPKAIFIVEGEKCAQALISMGITALTSQGGAQAAKQADWTPLSGFKKVYLFPDNNAPGEIYMKDVCLALMALESPPQIKVLRFDGLPEGGDVVDWIKSWGGFEWDEYEPIPEAMHQSLKEALRDELKKAELAPESWLNNSAPPLQSDSNEHAVINFTWTDDYIVSQAEAEKIANPDWIIPNLVIRGHVIVIAAKPNGGKTTIFMHVAEDMIRCGYRVFYVNSDISGGDAKHDIHRARKAGITLMLPDLKQGKSMEQVVNTLDAMNQSEGVDFNNVVFIFDTLKKMTDVIGKGSVRVLFSLLRGLSAKGMTSILLAHTNKYNADDGTPIFEGVGDIKSDSDELIYLVPQKNPDGSLVVSTLPDKVRGDFTPISFFIGADRSVKQLDEYVDVARENVIKSALDNDSQIIDAINQALSENLNKQIDIVNHCRDNFSINPKSTRRVLKIYIENSDIKQLWRTAKGMKNAVFYYLLDEKQLPPYPIG